MNKKLMNAQNLSLVMLGFVTFLFFVLLFKNPFSERNLIPNLEPYPDSIHYITPALSLVHGKGLYIEREGRAFKPTVPFLYSLVLAPGFLINDDARFFYITNILLAFAGFFLFYFSILRITGNKFISIFVLFLYATNYFVYWYPNLPMAENLGLTLFNASLFLFTGKLSVRNSIFAALLIVGFYGTKYANFTLSIVFGIFYFLKILIEEKSYKYIFTKSIHYEKLRFFIYFIAASLASLLMFFVAEYLIRGTGIFVKIAHLVEPLYKTNTESRVIDGFRDTTWFSYSYFNRNFPIYAKALFGEPMRFLWDYTPMLPFYVSWMGIVGLVAGIFTKGKKLLSLFLASFVLVPVVFLSTFYSADARYIYQAIPALLGGFSIFLGLFYKIFDDKKIKYIFYIFLVGLFAFYGFNNAYRLKYQIALNLKHTETPWHYLYVKNFNEFFSDPEVSKAGPVLVTAMPPYYVDYYSNKNYKLLPVSTEQEFSGIREIVWGGEDYSNFLDIYKKYLNAGRRVFVTNAGFGNAPFLYRDFNSIKDNFELIRVDEGCLNTCDIYEIKNKN